MAARRPTATSNFGVGRRESHDARPFYERFEAPVQSDDATVLAPVPVPEPFLCGDARHMDQVAEGSVALVVTSPPYFAGKQYEEELDREGVPGSYLEYLELLRDVFAQCSAKLEPGGRMAVNVANLGRKPYRSLSADVMAILQDELRLLPRGEIIWRKGEGASGSCAWGSFRSASNPVLRDVTERVLVVSKGRFDRARSVRDREAQGLPHRNSLTSDEFMAATLDVWEMLPERARRVEHPAPFPVELPERLIRLYTYEDDLILDPFMGSGSTLVAASRLERRYVGYDLDPAYVAIARARVAAEGAPPQHGRTPLPKKAPPRRRPVADDAAVIERARRDGKAAQVLATELLSEAGFVIEGRNVRLRGVGLTISLVARAADGVPWHFDVTGGFTTTRSGLGRADTLWKALGRAHVLAGAGVGPLILLSASLPARPGDADAALRSGGPGIVFDAIDLLDPEGLARLRRYAAGGLAGPLPGFWRHAELEPSP